MTSQRELGERLAKIAWAAALPVTMVVAYQLWAASAGNSYFPTIDVVAKAFVETWAGEGFTRHVVPSISNLFRGYTFGLLLGVLAGVALGWLPRLAKAVNPLLSFTLTIPTVALLPMFLIVFGVGEQLQVGVIVFAVFFYVAVTVADAVRKVEVTLLEVCRIYRVSHWRKLFYVLIPAVVPQILSSARVTLSTSVLVMVVSEMIGASRGIGAMTLLAQQSFYYDQMWAGMILVAILGISLNYLFAFGERSLLRRAGYSITRTESAK